MRAESLVSEDFAAADFLVWQTYFYRISLEMPASPKSWMLIGLPIEPAGVKVLAFGVLTLEGQLSQDLVLLPFNACVVRVHRVVVFVCVALSCVGSRKKGRTGLADAAYRRARGSKALCFRLNWGYDQDPSFCLS